jgi:hypothetical protein
MWFGKDGAVGTRELVAWLLAGAGRGRGGRGRCWMLLLRGGRGWRMRLRFVKGIGLVSGI